MSRPATVTLSESLDRGRALRFRLRRSEHGELRVGDRDPVGILEEQNRSRIAELVPVRMGRMLQSPFAYYRGTAAVMAHDLSGDPHTGQMVVACGDAHISNFGLYASPERRVLFDLNDFDEASVAPWEWDVKRLAASAVVGARDNAMSAEDCRGAAEVAVRNYRTALVRLHEMSALERFFFQVETDWLLAQVESDSQKVLRKSVKKARRRTADQVIEKLTVREGDGPSRIIEQPPVAQHVDHASMEELWTLFERYRSTLRADASVLMGHFELVDYILRVVGVGSVGTRCYIMLMEGPAREPLFIQAKEAPRSVLETHGRIPWTVPSGVSKVEVCNQGHRVVTCQRILQAQSDPFLGWISGFAGDEVDRRGVDYYWRQFRDMKGSIETTGLTPSQFRDYVALCGQLLARAHSQSPGGAVVAGYLGTSERFDAAVADWAVAYADQAERDFEALAHAVKSGRVGAEYGV